MTGSLLSGLAHLTTPEAIALLLVGVAVGMLMGILPGLGVSLVLSLMLPFLYHMSVVPAVALLLGAQAGSYYAASITAILLNTPGAPESFPTTIDGFPMAERGEAGKALAISATSTAVGGLLACGAFIGLIQVAGKLIQVFHPPEFMAVIVLALLLIGSAGSDLSASKVILSGAVGFMISFVGSDPVSGIERFTLGLPSLFSGISVVPFALGVFAITQMVMMFGANEAVRKTDSRSLAAQMRSQVWDGVSSAFGHWVDLLRSVAVAVGLGLIPGIGGFTANFISYGLGRQTSRDRKNFGAGSPAGLVSAEGSSLAKEVGSLIPAVALGLPSGVGMVIFIAGLDILGLQPGPTLLRSQPSLPYTMMWVMAVAGVLSCTVGLVITPWVSRVTSIRGPILFPFIVTLAVVGSFASVTNFSGVLELAGFALVGVVARKLGYSLAAMTIGLVLGNTFASNLHLTQSIYGWEFLSRSPLADVFLILSAVLLVGIFWRSKVTHQGKSGTEQSLCDHPILEPVTDLLIMVIGAFYSLVASGYPSDAGRLPTVVGALAALVAAWRLARYVVWRSKKKTLDANGPRVGEPVEAALAGRASFSMAKLAAGPKARSLVSLERGGGLPVADPTDAIPSISTDPERSTPRSKISSASSREAIALGWVALTVAACWLVGFDVGLPVAAGGYSVACSGIGNTQLRIGFAGFTAAASWFIAYGFAVLFHFGYSGLWLH